MRAPTIRTAATAPCSGFRAAQKERADHLTPDGAAAFPAAAFGRVVNAWIPGWGNPLARRPNF
jgi:hypothetical protein